METEAFTLRKPRTAGRGVRIRAICRQEIVAANPRHKRSVPPRLPPFPARLPENDFPRGEPFNEWAESSPGRRHHPAKRGDCRRWAWRPAHGIAPRP